MTAWVQQTAGRRPWVLILVVWAWLYLPCLGTAELHHEEGRRAGTAREMLARGEWAMPVFQGQPYLTKPPGYYWVLMASSRLFGGFNEWSIRIPSALSVLICALLAGKIARASGGHALVGGVAMLVMPEVWGKGQLGEIDAVFMAQVFASIALAWRAVRRPGDYAAAVLSGLFLGWAIITKGPAAPALYYLALAVWLAWERRARWLLSVQHAAVVVVAAAIVGTWIAFLARRMDLANAAQVWAGEVGAGRFEETAEASLKSFFVFPFGVLGGLLPGTLALIGWVFRRPEHPEGQSARRRLLSGTLPGFVMLWIHGRRVRYVLPVAPLAAIAAGIVFARPLARWFDSRKSVIVAGVVLLLAGVVRIGIMESRAEKTGSRKTGAELARILPADTPVHSTVYGRYWNACFYADRPFVAVDHPSKIPDSATRALVFKEEMPLLADRSPRILLEGEMRRSQPIVVVELQQR
ncbi:MAG TPA: glycosyltransferase family 39 protein, partial [Candidatus Hydrogenedentes bacterium]|nr:glycosyltransferase family 39 protein [Candidatus Hydrogenedentota bacterium]